MLNTIRKRLILLYTVSTGTILTIVLMFVFILANQQLMKSKQDGFFNNFITVSKNVQMNNIVSHMWIAEMEEKNQLIIHIEDNGQALLYPGAWKALTGRGILIKKVKELAQKDGIYTNIPPISMKEIQSNTYQFKGNANDSYLGAAFIVPVKAGYRSVVMLQYISDDDITKIKKFALIFLLDAIGITSLFGVSRWVVGKSLKPVEESRKRQTEFIAAASHELKSPLAVIRANASAMIIEPGELKHFSQGIDKECQRMSNLIEDMLLLASVDDKSWDVKKEILDMDTHLIETYEMFYPFCKNLNKSLKLELQEEILPKVKGDSERMKQILAVLIDNAAVYTRNNDTIILRAYSKKNHLWIEVEDHGEGIKEENKNEVFERFYRKDKARKDKNHYGLGLSIAKELVELHDGTITCKDTIGGGATFVIDLPVAIIEQ